MFQVQPFIKIRTLMKFEMLPALILSVMHGDFLFFLLLKIIFEQIKLKLIADIWESNC